MFVLVCLSASGWVEFERVGLARELEKIYTTMDRGLRELARKGVYEFEARLKQE